MIDIRYKSAIRVYLYREAHFTCIKSYNSHRHKPIVFYQGMFTLVASRGQMFLEMRSQAKYAAMVINVQFLLQLVLQSTSLLPTNLVTGKTLKTNWFYGPVVLIILIQ